jgi:hypothetical protein
MERTGDTQSILTAMDTNSFETRNAASYALLSMYKTLQPPATFGDVLIPVPPNEKKGKSKKKSTNLGFIYSGKAFQEALEKKKAEDLQKEEAKKERAINREETRKRKTEDIIKSTVEREEKKRLKLDNEAKLILAKQDKIREKVEKKAREDKEKKEKALLKRLQKQKEKDEKALQPKKARGRKKKQELPVSP